MNMPDVITLRWREQDRPNSPSWFIRRVSCDGKFFGEGQIETPPRGGVQWNVEGQLSELDNQDFHEAFRSILENRQSDEGDSDSVWTGVLSYGRLSNPTIVLRYNPGGEKESVASELFLKMIGILKRYKIEYQSQLT